MGRHIGMDFDIKKKIAGALMYLMSGQAPPTSTINKPNFLPEREK